MKTPYNRDEELQLAIIWIFMIKKIIKGIIIKRNTV